MENLDIIIDDKEIKFESDDLLTRKLSFKISFGLDSSKINELNDLIHDIFGEDIADIEWTNNTMENRISVIKRMIELLLYGTDKAPEDYASSLDNIREIKLIEENNLGL